MKRSRIRWGFAGARTAAIAALVAVLAGCQSGGGPTQVTIAPGSARLEPGASAAFTAGGAGAAVGWTVSCGELDGFGTTVTYTAPGREATCEVTARSVAAPNLSATATVDVERSPTGDVAWRRQFGSSLRDRATSVAFAEGEFGGGILVGGWSAGDLAGPNLGSFDGFVVRLDGFGNRVWTRAIATTGDDRVLGLAVSPDAQRIAAVGSTTGEFEPGGGSGGDDAFVRVLAARGTTVWTRQFGTAGVDRALAVAFAPDGDLVVVGTTTGSLSGQPYAGAEDLFVTRLSGTDGAPRWTRQFGTSNGDTAVAVAVAPDGWIAVVGSSNGAFAGPALGSNDAIVMRLEGNGDEVWRRVIGTSASDFGMGVAVAQDGGVLLTGYTFGALVGANAGASDGFLVRFEPDGSESWRRQWGAFAFDVGIGVVVDRLGQITVAGRTDGSVPGPHAGGSDILVLKFDADGGDLWQRQFGTSAADDAYAVALGYERGLVIVGETEGDLDGTNAGVSDVFVLNLRP